MRHLWPMAALASLLCACYSTPSPRYYVLDADADSQPAGSAPGPSIVVDAVTIPAVVDRPQFVLSGQGNEVFIDDGHRWAAPLEANLARALASDLEARVVLADASADGARPLPRYRVDVEILAFESRLGEDVRLEAVWRVRRDDGAASSGRSRFREPAAGRDFSSLAAAHSRTVASLAAEIALAIRDLGEAPRA